LREKARCQRGQVCDEKTNVCEPLLMHRKNRITASEPEGFRISGRRERRQAGLKSGCSLRVALAVSGV